jgi:putative transposase
MQPFRKLRRRRRRKLYVEHLHAYFVTFTCRERRKYLSPDRSKKIILGTLNSALASFHAMCAGFVVMPDHVHAIVWFPKPKQLSDFMEDWKAKSSEHVRRFFRDHLPLYWEKVEDQSSIWIPRYFPFNLFTTQKFEEKLDYMHMNSVRRGLVTSAVDYKWSSARWYLKLEQVGVTIQCPPGLY